MNQNGMLNKELGLWDVFCIASGAMISSGLFVLPGIIYTIAGSASFLAYLLAGVLVIPAMLCKAELATAMPKAGGTYFFIERSLGAAFGTLGGIASWFSLGLKSAFALFGIGAFGLLLNEQMPFWIVRIIALAACLVLTVINLFGARHAGRLQVVLVMGLLVVLVIYVFKGMGFIELSNFEGVIHVDWKAVWTATGMVFVSYGGLTKVASVAEEVKNPGRTLPLGMFLAFIVVTGLYVLVVLVTTGILGDRLMGVDGRGELNPLVLGGAVIAGSAGAVVMAAAAMMAYLSTGNAGLMSASRVPLAMARDQLIPERLSRLSARHGTPVSALVLTMLFMVAAILFLDAKMLVKTASTVMIILFLMVNLAVILMRESHIENYRPEFRTPLYPYLPIGGIIAYAFLVCEMGVVPILLTGAFFALGLLWFAFYGRIRTNRESALIRVARRLAPIRLTREALDGELREILRDRDGLVDDRFDRLIRECPILDLEGTLSEDDFFAAASKALAAHIGGDADEYARLLTEREAESSTVLKPGLAVPHILIEQPGAFVVLPARVSGGIQFRSQPDAAPVQAAFVLAGAADLRNYHLRVLMYIAQITQDPDFDRRWRAAAGCEGLRDLLLLAKRTRDPVVDDLF